MKQQLVLVALCMAWGLWGYGQAELLPTRLLYFQDTGRAYYAALDPGQEILDRNLLISNQAVGYNVSFSLSFDRQGWSDFALASRYASVFKLSGNEGCYIRIRTQTTAGPDGLREVIYFLVRGKCYSVYWNRDLKRWDVAEHPCRRE